MQHIATYQKFNIFEIVKQSDIKYGGRLIWYHLIMVVALFFVNLSLGNAQVVDTLHTQNEFILPSKSSNFGVTANLASYKIAGASALSNVGFEPALSFAAYYNLNKLVTHGWYLQTQYAWGSNINDQGSHAFGFEGGYRASLLLAPFGLITGVGYKSTVYDFKDITPNQNFWLTQIYIPAEVYWSKLLPSNNALLVQLSIPMAELVSYSNATYTNPISAEDAEPLTFGLINSDFKTALPLADFFGAKLGVAYVLTLSRTTALKVAYVFQYYQLFEPVYVNIDNGLTLVYQF